MSFLSLGRHWKYLRYVLIHKWYVFRAGCTLGIPWLALLHDNSKFLPDEWRWYASALLCSGRFEADVARQRRLLSWTPERHAFDRAWLSHIRRNKHHPQHWVRVRSACRVSARSATTIPRDGC
jgi:hypothetical protein